MTETEIQIYHFLDQCGVAYHALRHQPILTVEEGKLIAQQQGALCCKTLMLKNKKSYFLLMLPADKKLASKDLARQIGSGHLSFASSEELSALLHTFPGAVSVMGLIFDTEKKVNVLVDEDVLKSEFIDCHPCTNDCSLKIAVKDIMGPYFDALGVTYRLVKLA